MKWLKWTVIGIVVLLFSMRMDQFTAFEECIILTGGMVVILLSQILKRLESMSRQTEEND